MAARATARVPMMSHRILRWDSYESDDSDDPAVNLSNTIFGFLEEEGRSSLESIENEAYRENENRDGEEDEAEENSENNEDNRNFWETQHQQLQETLHRTSSLESRIRNATKEALREVKMAGNVCSCQRPASGGCRNCLMRDICSRLQNSGYNSAVCKSKWKSSPDIPSGEHTFLDVVDNSNTKKGEIRVIIELDFRGEFEMARASAEYNRLVSKLPEVFVGKIERLLALIKILCMAAKKCMKEKKMHLGPWRKHRYMQAKWLKVSERTKSSTPLSTGYASRPSRPRASMLTVVLLDNLPNLQCIAAVAVL